MRVKKGEEKPQPPQYHIGEKNQCKDDSRIK